MRVLLVKMSSLGDVVHCFPALTDALRARPALRFDWVVERSFAELPPWHPGVDAVIPIELRRWRRQPWRSRAEWRRFRSRLRERHYDLIIDAQGLVKSAVVARLARGVMRAGPDRSCAREPVASLGYERRVALPRHSHAVDRSRSLFASVLAHPWEGRPDYGLRRPAGDAGAEAPSLVFVHGSSWASKHWPTAFWRVLARQGVAAGYRVIVPSGTEAERRRAQAIAHGLLDCEAPPPMPLTELAALLAGARGVVTVDSGPGHLAAALAVPTIGLYGPTDPQLTGLAGHRARNLRAEFPCAPCMSRHCRYRGPAVHHEGGEVHPPCFASVPPERVWAELRTAMARHDEPGGGVVQVTF